MKFSSEAWDEEQDYVSIEFIFNDLLCHDINVTVAGFGHLLLILNYYVRRNGRYLHRSILKEIKQKGH